MLILIYIPSYKHVVIGKIRINEFHPPSTDNFDDSSYPYGIPKFSIHFGEKIRYRVSIDYIQPFGNLRLFKKVVWEKSQGGCNKYDYENNKEIS